jgi:hypothetical protein
MPLGITIRKGAEGFTLKGPEGTADLSSLTRDQLRSTAGLVSEAMGLEQRPVEKPQRNPRRRQFHHRNRSRKD